MWRQRLLQLLSFQNERRRRELAERTSQAFFEERYQKSQDPWSFASSSYELNRYRAILEALSDRTFARAFEPGCSIGVLTEQLAETCGEVEALDISATAVARAQERCCRFAHVHIRRGALPEPIPDGVFDLIVFSEIGYYFETGPLRELMILLLERLQPGGVLLASHWTGKSSDHVLRGDDVHQLIRGMPGISLTLEQNHKEFRLDRWVRT